MKSILLLVDSKPGFDGRLQAALDVARACGAHLTCLQANDYPAWALHDGLGMPLTAVDMEALNRSLEDGRRRERDAVEARLRRENVPWSWHACDDGRYVAIARLAALHDLVVAGAAADGDAGDVLLSTRTPVLVAPGGAAGFDPGRPVLIAWNGSPEAAAALKAAVPLIGRAAAVHLATVGEAEPDLPAESAARYLSRHGVHAEVHRVAVDRGVAAMLDALAQRLDAGWMVMGGYGRSRWREVLLGGVTQEVLRAPKRTVFICH